MDCALYDTEDMCFTGPMQVQWIGQLLRETAAQFVLHADGKHKLEARAVQSGLISRAVIPTETNRIECAVICGLDVALPCARAGHGAEGDGMASAGMAWHGGETHGLHGDGERQAGWHGGGIDAAGL
jgi:hypothetical protein